MRRGRDWEVRRQAMLAPAGPKMRAALGVLMVTSFGPLACQAKIKKELHEVLQAGMWPLLILQVLSLLYIA